MKSHGPSWRQDRWFGADVCHGLVKTFDPEIFAVQLGESAPFIDLASS